ncbi:MAG: hypothetical protein CSA22_04850 [Deltaproteobacteria bacterium]|nr:MAG: hypothetical protein CSA22_04850 [Deltaproteobacteria bacterium]
MGQETKPRHLRLFSVNPLTRKRLQRFREARVAFAAFVLLALLYGLSLGAECFCSDTPLYVRYMGRAYFPIFFFYPEQTFVNGGASTRPDYKAIAASEAFRSDPSNRMVFPLIPYGPQEIMTEADLTLPDEVRVVMRPVPRVASLRVDAQLRIRRSANLSAFTDHETDRSLRGESLFAVFQTLPSEFQRSVGLRFSNASADRRVFELRTRKGERVEAVLTAYVPRETAPASVRIRVAQVMDKTAAGLSVFRFDPSGTCTNADTTAWNTLPGDLQAQLTAGAVKRFSGPVDPGRVQLGTDAYTTAFEHNTLRFPSPPSPGHLMGIDSAGRDVLVRVVYGMRISMSFGFLLVIFSMCLGVAAGAVQGYFGGWVDLAGQRLIEIWSALPFLYVMILMGAVLGRSFSLLLICYGIFNWIGISYYIRAEFLKLRRVPFVEAARSQGLPTRTIMFRHVLPNALTTVITFFPFSLVGAIGALAALDYLGFGLPAPTASWGELLYQAQQYRWAWWLIVYPSLALFVVMMLCILIGEGVRQAFDPKRYARLE